MASSNNVEIDSPYIYSVLQVRHFHEHRVWGPCGPKCANRTVSFYEVRGEELPNNVCAGRLFQSEADSDFSEDDIVKVGDPLCWEGP